MAHTMRLLAISHCSGDVMVGLSVRERPPTNQEARELEGITLGGAGFGI